MKSQIPNPYGSSFESWAGIVAEQLAELGVAAPPAEEGWQGWAAELLNVSELGDVPSPYGFPSWQEWAAALYGINY